MTKVGNIEIEEVRATSAPTGRPGPITGYVIRVDDSGTSYSLSNRNARLLAVALPAALGASMMLSDEG